MATVKEIINMCKAGQIAEAYDLAKAGVEASPEDVWAQRSLGWALFYSIKRDSANGDLQSMLDHLEELLGLELLNMADDNLIFDNVPFSIGMLVKNNIADSDVDSALKLSSVFEVLRGSSFNPSRGYSYLLQCFLKHKQWHALADFIDWWNLDNLLPEDYHPFVMENGKSIMSLAEQAYNAHSKALLLLNDVERINAFLPKLDELMNSYPEMTYPGYYYGKLLMATGGNQEEALRVIIPFARKKITEFWVWQLISEVFANDPRKQLACLLRAANCRTQEEFLKNVRIKLCFLYVKYNHHARALYHMNKVITYNTQHGKPIPREIDYWIRQPWAKSCTPDAEAPFDFMALTNDIICQGAEESIAVVSNIDTQRNKVALIYGKKKKVLQKLNFKVRVGDILKIFYVTEAGDRIKVFSACKAQLPEGLDYLKMMEGTIEKRDDKDFAFLKSGSEKCYISPAIVTNRRLTNGEKVKCVVALSYDKKKDAWNWACISVVK